jgi:hypothetical protein
MQNSENGHRANIASHMQKVKHLEYEHLQSCVTVQGNAETVMNEEKTYHDKQESSNLDAKNGKKEEYNTDDIAYIAGVEEKQKEMQENLKDLAESLDI